MDYGFSLSSSLPTVRKALFKQTGEPRTQVYQAGGAHVALALLSPLLNLETKRRQASSTFGHQLPSHVWAGRMRMWKTTDAISSGLCFALAGNLSEPQGRRTGGSRHTAPALPLSAGAVAFPQHQGPQHFSQQGIVF